MINNTLSFQTFDIMINFHRLWVTNNTLKTLRWILDSNDLFDISLKKRPSFQTGGN